MNWMHIVEQGNQYVNWKIQELYKDMEQKKESNEERVKNKEVILIKPYKVSKSTLSIMKSSFIYNEVHEYHLFSYTNETI